ncbi:hypothetical protein [Kingella potus]|uniref:hypothetical protein n=1 Tax=Kingella potus TaxID=265175 RepID=UPI0011C06CD3|nr:hypothetical protein [Kingella potus]
MNTADIQSRADGYHLPWKPPTTAPLIWPKPQKTKKKEPTKPRISRRNGTAATACPNCWPHGWKPTTSAKKTTKAAAKAILKPSTKKPWS